MLSEGFTLVTGGTDNHLLLIDLSDKNIPGKVAAQALDAAGIVCNYNTVPFDKRTPFDPSGIRLGTPAVTSRGMKQPEMVQIARWMGQVLANPDDSATRTRVAGEVKQLCDRFPRLDSATRPSPHFSPTFVARCARVRKIWGNVEKSDEGILSVC